MYVFGYSSIYPFIHLPYSFIHPSTALVHSICIFSIYTTIYISLISFLQCVSVCNDDGTGYNSIIVFASDDFPNNFTLQWEPYPSDPFYIVEYRLQDSGSQFISSPIVS